MLSAGLRFRGRCRALVFGLGGTLAGIPSVKDLWTGSVAGHASGLISSGEVPQYPSSERRRKVVADTNISRTAPFEN